MHTRMKEELKCSLQKIPGRICLTSDMWTSLTTRSFLCLTAHYVDENWKLNSKLLNFSHVRPPHTAFELKTDIYRMLKEWGIDNKIFTITLDNASNMTNMQSELRDQLNGQQALLCAGKYFHIRCCGHILNLIVQDGLKVIRDGVRSVRESVKYVDGSEARKIKFQECIAQAGLKCTKGLWLDVPTRWNSTYMMLDRALFYRQAFVNLTRIDKDYKDFPSVENWEKVSALAKLLKPFDDITKVFSGTKYPTTNLFFKNVWLIHLQLIQLCSSTDEVLSSMGKVMMSKFKKYWEDYNSVLAFGVIMDPRYKLAFVKYCHGMLGVDYSFKWMDIQEELYLLFDEYKKVDTS
ncbi:Zinc finger BED domain-containing protein RICESLEEPER 2 [Linum perenne]